LRRRLSELFQVGSGDCAQLFFLSQLSLSCGSG
jgi:hypothetical protein